MNPGGEPERDDTGLPPVDIEVPDDARELDRDVQAYYREQRALRRHQRSSRLHGTLGRDGMVVPLLVICLIFALIAGTLLTLFTATSINQNLQGTGGTTGPTGSTARSPASTRASAGPSASAGAAAGGASHPASGAAPGGAAVGTHALISASAQVAAAIVAVRGTSQPVRSLRPAVLLLVPPACNCDAAITKLADLASGTGAPAYLIAKPAAMRRTGLLARQLGHGLTPAEDVKGTVAGSVRSAGLTAILVAADGSVSYARGLQDGIGLAAILQQAHL